MELPANVECLDAETLAAYLDGLLGDDAISRADRHIDHCSSCRGELSALAATHSFPVGSGSLGIVDGLVLDGRIGRYEVLREIGRGSMGVVVRAYDPELERAVAVKILDARRLDGADAPARLRREAQAMARLSHPNVVTVYDVVSHGDAICIAMELVEGDTLAVHARTREWRDTLATCIAAGRGLAAAHAARLIHRDYKPENVLCAADGRVVVSDFGLARLEDAPLDRTASATTTTLAGTPAYMAPELFRGQPATTASDQFSFCVATWEALYGERPFGGDSLDDLRAHIAAGIPRTTAQTRVPPWVRGVLLRGLAPDPANRYPSVAALLDALERDPARARRRWARLAIAAAAGGLAVIVALGVRSAATGKTCTVDALYDPATLAIAPRMAGALADYADSFTSAYHSACAAGSDSQLACLDRARRELAELTALLAREPQLADRGVDAVYRLPDPAACAASTGELDPAAADNDRAAALLAAGHGSDATAIAAAIPNRTHDDATLAEALLIRGRAQLSLGDFEAAEPTLTDALTHAERAHADSLVPAIWVELVQVTGTQKHHFEAAEANIRGAEAAFARAEPGPALRTRFAYVVGAMRLAQGKLAEARTQLERALAGSRAGERGFAHSALCDVERQARHFDAARTHCKTAIAELAAAFGPDHERLAPTYNVTGALELDAGNPAAARAGFERAAAILEHRGLVGERALALALSNAATVWMRTGDFVRARPLFERSRDLFAKYHPDHPQRVLPLQGLASTAIETGDYRTAIRSYEEALGVIEAVYGKDSDQRPTVLYNLALAYQRLPDPDKAIELCEELATMSQHPGREDWQMVALALDAEAAIVDKQDPARAVTLRERALAALANDDRPPTRAWLESQLGTSLRHAHQPARAIAPLERSVAYYDKNPEDRYYAGIARDSLARALWDTGQHPRAITLATAALADFTAAKAGLNLAGKRAELVRWLADHH